MMGCGQKGPLVLPDAARPHKKIGIVKPAQHTPSPAQPAASGAQSPASGSPAPAPGTPPSAPDTQTPTGAAVSAPQP
jgi:predicted small lipoprotein YifL